MKTKLMLVLVAMSCVGCDGPRNWEVVQNDKGEYGYVDWAGRIIDGYHTCEAAKAARDKWKVWSDDFDARHGLWWKPKIEWKKADCQ